MKKISIILCCLTMFVIGACSVGVVSAKQTNPIKISFQNESGILNTWIVKDEITKVEYIVVSTYTAKSGTSITPRYNADGTLYTGE